jgi:tetratricopeptide (TPR) repeat protein
MDERLKTLYNSGREKFTEGKYDDAMKSFSEFIENNQSFADVYEMLGIICHQRGTFDRAIEYFKKATELNPRYTEASINLAVTYMDIGQYNKAREVYSRIRAVEAQAQDAPKKISDHFARGKLANMHMEIADIYRSFGLFNEAIDEYKKSLELEPEFVDVLTKLGMALRDKGKLLHAIGEWEEAKRIKPTYSPARLNLGVAYYSLGKMDNARTELNEILKYDPENRQAKMYLRMIEEME